MSDFIPSSTDRRDDTAIALRAALARVAELEDECAICRDAVEDVLELVESIETRDLDDSAAGALRASRRKLSEAIGKATPRLLMEKPEGQKFYGLHWRELRAENTKLRAALERLLSSVPVAADCPTDDANVVAYTDHQWDELRAATDAAKEALR
jgi:hypothetical protein